MIWISFLGLLKLKNKKELKIWNIQTRNQAKIKQKKQDSQTKITSNSNRSSIYFNFNNYEDEKKCLDSYLGTFIIWLEYQLKKLIF